MYSLFSIYKINFSKGKNKPYVLNYLQKMTLRQGNRNK